MGRGRADMDCPAYWSARSPPILISALPLAALPVCCATGLHSIGPLAHWPIAPSTANASRLQGRAFSPAARYERAVVNVSDNEALSEASLPVERGIRWQGKKKMRGYSVV